MIIPKKQKPMKFTMPFQPTTIEHLGLRLYSKLTPVISELVSNAFDAEATSVEITLPEGNVNNKSEVVVKDTGHGMTGDELQDEYLPIGRNRREAQGSLFSKNKLVKVTGRKGLGKLSGFGVAKTIEIRSIKDGYAVCISLNYDEMTKWHKDHPKRDYEPKIITEKTGSTGEPNGCEVKLKQLKRTGLVDSVEVRKGLAQRLLFIGANFQVTVNGQAIGPGDRLQKSDCLQDLCWDVKDVYNDGVISTGQRLEGWIGFLDKSSQTGRGIDIFANKKAVELGSYFGSSTTHAQFARAYIVGEIQADFLDADDDLIGTARNFVLWENEIGQAFSDWGKHAVPICLKRWTDSRRIAKEQKVTQTAGYADWRNTRPPAEQRVADKMVKMLVDDESLESDSIIPILEIIKSSVETVAFRELIDRIEAEGSQLPTLIRLFDEWRVIEAREHLNLASGRKAALKQLRVFIDQGALEVSELQPLLTANTWLIDPTWISVDIQSTYTNRIRMQFPESPKVTEHDRRLDLWGVLAGNTVTIVEIKRPEKTLGWDDLEQIERYVYWARSNLCGTGQHAPNYVRGLLIVGKQSMKGEIQQKVVAIAASDIRVETYNDIYQRGIEYYNTIDKKLKEIAPEYFKYRFTEKTDGSL